LKLHCFNKELPMRKIFLSAACASLIGLALVMPASAQFVTGANEGASTSAASGDQAGMKPMHSTKKKKKMTKASARSGGEGGGMEKSTGTPSMPQGGGMQKSTGTPSMPQGGGMEKKM
jgi:hypothetical protein